MNKNKTLLILGALVVAAVALAYLQGWIGGPKGGKYNVLLISIDSLRQDRVGIYGHKPEYAPDVAVSPNIDALAREGVTFDNAWSNTSWTLPSHASLMTGLTDLCHGVVQDDFRIDPAHLTLAERMLQAGYRTAGYFSGPFVGPKYGFSRGFQDYQSAMGRDEFMRGVQQINQQRKAQNQPPLTPQMIARLWDRQSHLDITSPRLNQFAQDFLDDIDADDPFFLFLHYFDVHYDHIPPPDLAKKFDPGYTGTMTGKAWHANPLVRDPKTRERKISERDLGHVKALYDAELNYVDHHLGAVFEMLKQKGVYDTTMIVILADHGDEFFEHGDIGHRQTLYTEVTSIPLIIKVPGEIQAGGRISELANLYDIAPTILDFVGVESLPAAQGRSLRGVTTGADNAAGHAMHRLIFYGGERSNLRDAWRNERYTVNRRFTTPPFAGSNTPFVVERALNAATRLPWIEVFDRNDDPGEHLALAPSDPRYQEALRLFCADFHAMQTHCAQVEHSDLEERRSPRHTEEELVDLAAVGYVDSVANAGSPRTPPPGPFPSPCDE